MRGQKRVEDARKRAYDPRVHHSSNKAFLQRRMDCRVKPGNDGVRGHDGVISRHARAWRGHPRLPFLTTKDVDGIGIRACPNSALYVIRAASRVNPTCGAKPDHDENTVGLMLRSEQRASRSMRPLPSFEMRPRKSGLPDLRA